jgi:hypothetical protein
MGQFLLSRNEVDSARRTFSPFQMKAVSTTYRVNGQPQAASDVFATRRLLTVSQDRHRMGKSDGGATARVPDSSGALQAT